MKKITELNILIHEPDSCVWTALIQMNQWNLWNPGIERVQLLETPKEGAIGRIRNSNHQIYQFKINQLLFEEMLEIEQTYRLGAVLIYRFSLTHAPGGTLLTTSVYCDKGLSRVVAWAMNRSFSKLIKNQGMGLKRYCEDYSHVLNPKHSQENSKYRNARTG